MMSSPFRNSSPRLPASSAWLLVAVILLLAMGAVAAVYFFLPGLESRQPTPQSTASPTPLPSPTATPYAFVTVEVAAAAGWQSTGLQVNLGDKLEITYVSGLWTGKTGNAFLTGPEGGHPSQDYICNPMSHKETGFNALIGKIWYGEPFKVGRHFAGTADVAGTLYLRMNDCDKWLVDNEGSVVVTIQVGR
jgi:hypothetical protein